MQRGHSSQIDVLTVLYAALPSPAAERIVYSNISNVVGSKKNPDIL